MQRGSEHENISQAASGVKAGAVQKDEQLGGFIGMSDNHELVSSCGDKDNRNKGRSGSGQAFSGTKEG